MTGDYDKLLEKLKGKDLKVKIRIPKNVEAQMSDYNDYYVRIQGMKDEFDESDIKREEKIHQEEENTNKIINQVIEDQLEVPQITDASQESQLENNTNNNTDEEKQIEVQNTNNSNDQTNNANNEMKIQLNEGEEQEIIQEKEESKKNIVINKNQSEENPTNNENEKEDKTKQNNAMSIIDQLLEAKDVFDVDLSSLKPKPEKYPMIPTDIIFRSKEEKQIFEKLYNWLFEIEMDLNRERKEIQEQKRIRNQVLYDSEQIKQDIEGDSSGDEGDDDDDDDDDDEQDAKK